MPIIIIGDFQETLTTGNPYSVEGMPLREHGLLQYLLLKSFSSAYCHCNPHTQATRWNSTRTVGQMIDLHMNNAEAEEILEHANITPSMAPKHVTSDHMLICLDCNFNLPNQKTLKQPITCYQYMKIAGIKMQLKQETMLELSIKNIALQTTFWLHMLMIHSSNHLKLPMIEKY